jgi:hypothetical protein
MHVKPLLIGSSVLLVGAIAVASVYAQAAKTPAKAQPASPAAAAKQVTMPPFPGAGYAGARPMNVAHAAYRFAAEHPEILKFVPCYCGCESTGHTGNETCFVKRRDTAGNVTEWDPHGYGCAVCIDVAREAEQLFRSGADAVAIRGAIERKWTPKFPTKTPTPMPARKH